MSSARNQFLYINSNIDRKPTEPLNSSSFTTVLSNPIQSYSGRIKAKITEVEWPNVYYSFSENACLFWYKIVATGEKKFLQIPTNRFFVDGSQFVSVINAICLAENHPLTFTYSIDTSKLTVENTGVNEIRLLSSYRYENEEVYNDCMDKMGFQADYRNMTPLDQGDSIEATAALRLLRTNCCYLQCDMIASQSINTTSIPSPYFPVSNIMARISSSNFGILSQFQTNPEQEFDIGTGRQITEIKWSMLDENYDPISTNGHPVTFAVLLRYV